MFEALSHRLSQTFSRLRKRGVIQASDLEEALQEILIALLEADVALEVTKRFVEDVRHKALGQAIIRSITPDQMIVKIVNDHLVSLLDGEIPLPPLSAVQTPLKVMLVGLQGSGKTTSTAKIAYLLTKKSEKRAVVASTDVYRPAAIEQLRVLTQSVNRAFFVPATASEAPLAIAERALSIFTEQRADVLVLDTAGRLHTDETLMQELKTLVKSVQPEELLLVADMMMGQDALNIARAFSARLPLTGIVLTRADSESRGGVALSMRLETGCPIRALGTGEHLDDIEIFNAHRIVDRLLGKGDIVSLVEKASEVLEKEETEASMARLNQGVFTLTDLAHQLKQVSKMGGIASILKMLPGAGALDGLVKKQDMDDQAIARQLAIISSMTPKERRYYKLINGSRRRRIAAGSGSSVQDVNKLLKNYEKMLEMQKKLRKLQKRPGFGDKLQNLLGKERV
ncbi:MAG: signal recognition particle protein [Holosporales bacterium]|jgi:signal recognition particle subunit SRP54|nr:signal recognition particle protein [Holosporales bacterium]